MSTRRITRQLSGKLPTLSAPLSTKAGITKKTAKTKTVNSKITATLKVGKATKAGTAAKGKAKAAEAVLETVEGPVKIEPAGLESTKSVVETTTEITTVVGAPDPILKLDADLIVSQVEAGIAHIKSVEPRLASFFEKGNLPSNFSIFEKDALSNPFSPFSTITSGILSQQVSGAAAMSIKEKFKALFGGKFPTPAEVLTRDIPTLRTAGLSQRKAEYVRGLAEHFVAGKLKTDTFTNDSDEVITEKLVAVRGIGEWSAQMFLLFHLRRMDIFSVGDLGIQRGMAVFAGKNVAKLRNSGSGKWKYMSEADMLKESERFKPYRSLFCLLMWKLSDTSVESMTAEKKPKKGAKSKKTKTADEAEEEE